MGYANGCCTTKPSTVALRLNNTTLQNCNVMHCSMTATRLQHCTTPHNVLHHCSPARCHIMTHHTTHFQPSFIYTV